MGTAEVYTEEEKRALIEAFLASRLSVEAFARRIAADGQPLKVTTKTFRLWLRTGRTNRRKSGPRPLVEKPIEDPITCRLIALAIFTLLNRGKRRRDATYIFDKLGRILTIRQVRYRIKRLRALIKGLSTEAYAATCLELKEARRKVNQRHLVYQIDATLIPARAFDPAGEGTTEVWVTIALDVATRLIVGFEVHFRYPTYADTLRALLRALLPSSGLSFVGGGLPWIVQTDNGSISSNPNPEYKAGKREFLRRSSSTILPVIHSSRCSLA